MAGRSWNKAELIGNLTRDPEIRYTPSGTAVCTFSIATNRTYMSEGERKEDVDFHRIVAWAKLGELCSQLLKKGTKVFVSGRIQYREWDGQDGQKRQTTEIVIDDMVILSSKGGYEGGEEGTDAPVEQAAPPQEPASTPVSEEPTREPVPQPEDAPAAKKAAPKKQETVNDDDLPF